MAKEIIKPKKAKVKIKKEEPVILKAEEVIKKPEVEQERIEETKSTLTRETN